jgi:hypothetical protein
MHRKEGPSVLSYLAKLAIRTIPLSLKLTINVKNRLGSGEDRYSAAAIQNGVLL